MKKLTLLTLAGLGLFMFFSCKKNSSGNANGPTVDSVAVLGQWQLLRDVSYFYASSNGALLDSASQATSQSYFDFEKGGVLIIDQNNGTPQTVAYQIVQNQYLVINLQDTINLKVSANAMLLTKTTYNEQDANVTATQEDTVELVK